MKVFGRLCSRPSEDAKYHKAAAQEHAHAQMVRGVVVLSIVELMRASTLQTT